MHAKHTKNRNSEKTINFQAIPIFLFITIDCYRSL
ncbi:hypothetical protein EVA_12821 [gut metagenome]|uniref:Uncharacterized protein n=1 Tax=gut metagenome TaxID=749906 RepID=J9GHZ2_9ZZZZ